MQLVAVLRKTCTVLAVIAMGWASFMIVYKSALGVRQHKNVGIVITCPSPSSLKALIFSRLMQKLRTCRHVGIYTARTYIEHMYVYM